jgi:hypothetical protein
MTLDLSRPVQTRDGRSVRILCTDLKNNKFPIVAALVDEFGVEYAYQYETDGTFKQGGGELDLINVPTKRTIWCNVYLDPHDLPCIVGQSTTKEGADNIAGLRRIACIPVEIEVPQ